jgi:hypothetical protein
MSFVLAHFDTDIEADSLTFCRAKCSFIVAIVYPFFVPFC